jgi:guanylate kinase
LNKKGEIIVISAPSGAGKTSIVKRLIKEIPGLVFSVSATTRKKRENEENGIDYFFLSEDEFKNKIKNNEFVEWEKVYDYYYGTFKSYIDKNITKGNSVIFEVDVNGAMRIKNIYPDAHLIYVLPPSHEELIKRLKNRKTDDDADIQKRVERAIMELSITDKFDYLIENKDLEKAVCETKELIKKIINKEKYK